MEGRRGTGEVVRGGEGRKYEEGEGEERKVRGKRGKKELQIDSETTIR